MKKIILTIYTICTMFALSANAKQNLSPYKAITESLT